MVLGLSAYEAELRQVLGVEHADLSATERELTIQIRQMPLQRIRTVC